MKNLVIVVFIIGCAYALPELHHLESSFRNGVKWELLNAGKVDTHPLENTVPTPLSELHSSQVYASDSHHHDQPAVEYFKAGHVDLHENIDSPINQGIYETPYSIEYHQPGVQSLQSGFENDLQPVLTAHYRTHYKPQGGYHYPRPVNQHC